MLAKPKPPISARAHQDHLIQIVPPLDGETSCPVSLSLSTQWFRELRLYMPFIVDLTLIAPLRQSRPTSRASFIRKRRLIIPRQEDSRWPIHEFGKRLSEANIERSRKLLGR